MKVKKRNLVIDIMMVVAVVAMTGFAVFNYPLWSSKSQIPETHKKILNSHKPPSVTPGKTIEIEAVELRTEEAALRRKENVKRTLRDYSGWEGVRLPPLSDLSKEELIKLIKKYEASECDH